MPWPWISRRWLQAAAEQLAEERAAHAKQIEKLEREANNRSREGLVVAAADSEMLIRHHAEIVDVLQQRIEILRADVEYERGRWMQLINAERLRADKAQDLFAAAVLRRSMPGTPTVPGGSSVSGPKEWRGGGPIDGEALAAAAQTKADKEWAANPKDPDPVPGMTDPFAEEKRRAQQDAANRADAETSTSTPPSADAEPVTA